MAVCRSNDNITGNCSVRYLASDILVAEPDNETVLRGVVLVLVLRCQPQTSTVIGLSLPPPLVLHLVSAEVSTAALDLDIHHGCSPTVSKRASQRDSVFRMLGTRRLCQLGFLSQEEEEEDTHVNMALPVFQCRSSRLGLQRQ